MDFGRFLAFIATLGTFACAGRSIADSQRDIGTRRGSQTAKQENLNQLVTNRGNEPCRRSSAAEKRRKEAR